MTVNDDRMTKERSASLTTSSSPHLVIPSPQYRQHSQSYFLTPTSHLNTPSSFHSSPLSSLSSSSSTSSYSLSSSNSSSSTSVSSMSRVSSNQSVERAVASPVFLTSASDASSSASTPSVAERPLHMMVTNATPSSSSSYHHSAFTPTPRDVYAPTQLHTTMTDGDTMPTGASSSSSPSYMHSVASTPETVTVATTLAKRTNVKAASTNGATANYDNEEDEDDDTAEDDLSIENYMRRHPCILDRSASFLERHSWIYQAIVLVFTLAGVIVGTMIGIRVEVSSYHFGIAYVCLLADLALFAIVSRLSPGRPASCPSESSVIQLLHSWPSSSHHYGLHASEWSRSWSYCEICQNWRPARTHHCKKCNQCVLMMDHHCVWIGQCVGAGNFRLFFAYVTLTTLLSFELLYLTYSSISHPHPSSVDEMNLVLFLLALFIGMCGATAAGWLLIRCIFIVTQNETHVEGLKKSAHERLKREDALNKRTDGVNRSTALTKESMLHDAGNGSRLNDASKTLLASPTANGRYFAPFQCSCHTDSFRVYYCQSFDFPSLKSSSAPIPPIPYYHDYNANEYGMNWYLFWEDLKRMERLNDWVRGGSKPITIVGRHMKNIRDLTTTQSNANGSSSAQDFMFM